MTDLTDEHFRTNIQQNPDDDLARGIYADWLEEQGDERSQLIRLFQQAAAGDTHALFQLSYDTDITELARQLSPAQCRRAAVDVVWNAYQVIQGDPESIHVLGRCWANSEKTDTAFFAQTFGGRTYTPWPYSLCYVCFHPKANVGLWYVCEDVRDDKGRHRREGLEPLLIAFSYYLFGANVLLNSFERTGLLNDRPD